MLDQIPMAEEWLAQFPLVDAQVARQLLRSLHLVSNSQFEHDLDDVLDRLLEEVGKECISLLSVSELVSSRRALLNPGKVFRQPGSSADRVRHYLENFARVRSKRARAQQTIESMRAERIRNVVLVDDFIGSGRRITTYLRKAMHPSLKSWISYGWTKLWVVAYGALSDGVYAIERCGYRLSENRIKLVTPKIYPGKYLSDAVRAFCRRQAHRTIRSSIPLGFSNGGVNLIFEHGCPNNAPVVLWSMGKGYKPLFPNRGIPTELRPAFGADTSSTAPEVLWDSSQYQLALALLEEKRFGRERALWQLVVAMGLASRSQWKDDEISSALGKPIISVERLRQEAVSLGVLQEGNHQLTAFGRSLLDLIRTNAAEPQMHSPRKQRDLAEVYYPWSYEGEPRH